VAEGSEEAGAEAVVDGGVAGMMLVEAPLDAEEAFAESADDLAWFGWLRWGSGFRWGCRLRAGFFDGDGDFVFELDAVAEAVVDVEVGDLVGAGGGVAVADEAEVDLPVLIAGGFGVVGAEGWAALGVGEAGE